ncbi:hypothetical protein CAPTEDRAFT_201830 [Capitella teleta]|uniref:Reverse transcriptase domain-containing protein n=1 Tax=Capitella teleta TaxID=283909 RepID=R7UAM0_CAPTE|nr:hypothetical protein CAPTEDRAFT_201830 [Capitella teleta]|eukprot:ELU03009.1 hypothetical protein CAPTEDRAFT_201830 [Capitella teleta]
MIINESKTQFMVINGEEDDRNPIIHDDLNITNCDMYTYLGARFTQDGRLTSSVKAQVAAKMCHVVKFETFVRRNPDAPVAVNKKVFSAALVAAILYGSTHPMYADPTICEYKRRALTKFRLSSHNLAIKRERWSRTPRHERLGIDCDLNAIQDEEHVLSVCPRFHSIRTDYPSVNFHFPDFFK